MLRTSSFPLVVATLAALLTAQDEQAELAQLRAKKLQAGFLTRAPWQLDFAKAQAAAQQEQKLIFGYFTRSYAPCPYCTAVETGELVDAKFLEFAKGLVLFCHVSSMVADEPYPDLLPQKGGNAFPYFVVMDARGNVLAPHQGAPTTEGFGRTVTAAREMEAQLAELTAQAGKGDAAAAVALFEQQLALNHLTAAAAKERFKTLKNVDPARKVKFTALIAKGEVTELIGKVTEDPKSQYECGKAFAQMLKEERIPPEGQEQLWFWYLLSVAAEQDQDAALLSRAVTGIKAVANAPKSLVDQIEERLQRVKEPGKEPAREPAKEAGKGH